MRRPLAIGTIVSCRRLYSPLLARTEPQVVHVDQQWDYRVVFVAETFAAVHSRASRTNSAFDIDRVNIRLARAQPDWWTRSFPAPSGHGYFASSQAVRSCDTSWPPVPRPSALAPPQGRRASSRIPRSVSTARTRSPASRCRRSAISFGRVALTEPPAWRSVTSLVTCGSSSRVAYWCYSSQQPTTPLQSTNGSARSMRTPATVQDHPLGPYGYPGGGR